jgi:ABC-type multidrug transport system ATPase subunit
MDEVEYLADKVILLKNGSILETGTVDELKQKSGVSKKSHSMLLEATRQCLTIWNQSMESQISTIIETKSQFTEMDLDWEQPFPTF